VSRRATLLGVLGHPGRPLALAGDDDASADADELALAQRASRPVT
jgi:hypothetical protein